METIIADQANGKTHKRRKKTERLSLKAYSHTIQRRTRNKIGRCVKRPNDSKVLRNKPKASHVWCQDTMAMQTLKIHYLRSHVMLLGKMAALS